MGEPFEPPKDLLPIEVPDPDDEKSRATYKTFTLPDGTKVDVLWSIIGATGFERFFATPRALKSGRIPRWNDAHEKARVAAIRNKAVAAQDLFVKGRRFRIIKDGAQLQTVERSEHAAKHNVWLLKTGNVISCLGHVEPWGKGVHRLIVFGGSQGQAIGQCVVFAPSIGTFTNPHPDPQYLEALDELNSGDQP